MYSYDLEKEKRFLKTLKQNKLSFSLSYLNDSLSGILMNDIIVISAFSGIGKSEIGSIIAVENAKQGKNVYVFALEAFKYEFDLRIKYREVMKAYTDRYTKANDLTFADYLEDNIPTDLLRTYFNEIDGIYHKYRENLFIRYFDDSYSIEDFEKDLVDINVNADLIILDHLHYFQYDETKEYSEISKIIKKIKYLSTTANIPIIIISHLRKNNKMLNKIVPDIDDLHGSSNIAKIATKVILFSQDRKNETEEYYKINTIIRVVKNRYNGSAIRYLGIMSYDIRSNSYSNNYKLARLSLKEDDYEIITEKIPAWCKNVC